MTTSFDVMCAITTVATLAYGVGMLLPGHVMYAKFFFRPELWSRLVNKIDTDAELKNLFWVLIWGGVGLTWLSLGLVMLAVTLGGVVHKKEFAAINVAIWLYWMGIYVYILTKRFWTPQANVVNFVLTLGMVCGWALAAEAA